MKSNKVIMSLRSPIENKKSDFVMPAWIAGIQVREDAPETSVSAWIPALHAGMRLGRDPARDRTRLLMR